MKKLYFALLLSLVATGSTQAAQLGNGKLADYVNTIVAIPGNGVANVTASLLESVGSIISSFGKSFSDAGKKIQENGNIFSK